MSYSHPFYAQSLREFGQPLELPRCGGWILERPIAGTPYKDAMGCYPLFSCRDWTQIHKDLEEVGHEWVSLTLVTDPFGGYEPDNLRRCFPDVMVPFKEHFVADLCRPLEEIVGRRHRKNARRALKEVHIDVCGEPTRFMDEWLVLYRGIIDNHGLTGIPAFSRASFAKQLSIPGTVVLRATYNDLTIGAQIYFMQGDVVYCHLGAANQTGYDLGAFFALDYFSIEYFSGKVRWLNLGGGAGISTDGNDGLSRYKKGWSTETRPAYFCGRIFNSEIYGTILREKNIGPTDYFPAYRKGEFGSQNAGNVCMPCITYDLSVQVRPWEFGSSPT